MAREDVETTISVNGGPQIPINLGDIDAPENADAKEALTGFVSRALGPSVASDELRLFIERIERLEEEKKGLSDDIKDVYAEAKSQGYDAKIMRLCIRLRKMEPQTLQEQVALLETYADAIGLQHVLPL